MIKNIIFLLCFFSFVVAQNHDIANDYTTISTSNQSNPAWMIKNYSGNYYSYGIDMDRESGDYKLPYIPEESLNINYIARGEKKLFQRGLFSGYVAFHQQNLVNKKWIHNRQPYQGFPFLLADSSVGDMKLNGIHWQLGYTHEIIKNRLFLGSQLFYNVDEQFKQVFPKPINKHCDMVFNLGVGNILTDNIQIGFNYTYFDIQEIMKTSKYSLEQDKTPIFIKIRGLDNPLILRGETSLERELNYVGNSFQFDGKISNVLFKEINFIAEYENARAKTVDGGAYPINQGSMDSDELFFSADIKLPFIGKSEIDFFTYGKQINQYSIHPEIDIEIFEYKIEQLAVGINFVFPLSNRIQISPTLFGSSQFLKRVDKFNGILEYFPSTTFGGSIGFDMLSLNKFSLNLRTGTEIKQINKSETFIEREDWYYQQIIKQEEKYYNSDKMCTWISSDIRYRYDENKSLILNIRYNSLNDYDDTYSDLYRSGLSIGLKIEMKK